MDKIDIAIEDGRHITKNSKIVNKTWNDFFNAAQEKKVILYGITDLVNFLWIRGNKNISIVAAIDNSIKKQDHLLTDFIDEDELEGAKDIKISSKDIASFNSDGNRFN